MSVAGAAGAVSAAGAATAAGLHVAIEALIGDSFHAGIVPFTAFDLRGTSPAAPEQFGSSTHSLLT